MKVIGPAALLAILTLCACVSSQRTVLDEKFQPLYRPLRLFMLNLTGRTGNQAANVEMLRRNGRTQRQLPLDFFCDARNGPGRRSPQPPTSIHKLRPGDIDIVGALGDSLTAGNGIMATQLLHLLVENRGISFAIGGQGTWRDFLTVPNILKEFNPRLYGYSLGDGLASERSSRFNVAELAAMSRDIPFEAKQLVKRMTSDRHVNMTHHWKLVTLLIGNNDFCSDMCYRPNPWKVVDLHEQDMVRALRFLRDNVPRLMVNIVPSPNLRFLAEFKDLPPRCKTTLPFECPCIVGKARDRLDLYEQIMARWTQVDREVALREEFNTETFTVNVQPFTENIIFPKDPKTNKTDYSYFSVDCFHLSQKGQALSVNSLWNNMLAPEGKKVKGWVSTTFKDFKCPTKRRPYLATRSNS